MTTKIENEFLEVIINTMGAELFSIKSKCSNIEYLWQGNKEFWEDRSPLLFPICGRLFGGKYYFSGKEYEMPIHGFSRLKDFAPNKISSSVIEFTLYSSEETKESYPFDFVITIRYELDKNSLNTRYIVKNTGNKALYFSYGAHPGFNVPFTKDEDFTDYYLEFSKNELEKMVFSDTCFNTGRTQKIILSDKKLKLSHDLFDNDAIFLKTKTDSVKLKSIKHKNHIEVSYQDMTCLGLWHMPKTDAPYVCIEPWHGLPSSDGVIDHLETKLDMITLAPNEKYENFYTIKIKEN